MKRIPKDMLVGSVHHTLFNGSLEVIEYISASKVKVRFINTGYERFAANKEIRSGMVKDNMMPVIAGVGYIGDGKYTARVNGEVGCAYMTRAHMIKRCYCEKSLKIRPTYNNVSVCKSWHNFQNFAKWYYENHPNDGLKYDLDKDIKQRGIKHKVYSPDTCMFVTHMENIKESGSRRYKIKSPEGEVFDVVNLAEFCRNNNLSYSGMHGMAKYKWKKYKGWSQA